jgi:hypothetical protein
MLSPKVHPELTPMLTSIMSFSRVALLFVILSSAAKPRAVFYSVILARGCRAKNREREGVAMPALSVP